MICPVCNKEIPDGSAFCTECGATINAAEPTAAPAEAMPEEAAPAEAAPAAEMSAEAAPVAEAYAPTAVAVKKKVNPVAWVAIGVAVIGIIVALVLILGGSSDPVVGEWRFYGIDLGNGMSFTVQELEDMGMPDADSFAAITMTAEKNGNMSMHMDGEDYVGVWKKTADGTYTISDSQDTMTAKLDGNRLYLTMPGSGTLIFAK